MIQLTLRTTSPLVLLVASLQSQAPGAPSDQAASQFIAIAREADPIAAAKGPRYQITIWDIPRGKPAARRANLGHSPWQPTPLVRSPKLLRWQVATPAGDGGGPYEVKLLKADLRSFEVTELLHTESAKAIGQAGDQIYLETSSGQSVLNLKTGIISELSPEIFVIAKHGDDWLVEVNGVIARYDATKATIARRYPEFGRIEDRRASRAEWHGGRFAILEGDFFDAAGKPLSFLLMGTPSIVYQRLRILDLETAAESRIMVRRQATGGSGVAVIPSEMYTELIGGMFRYTERRAVEDGERPPQQLDWQQDVEWVTIDIANGKELLREPYQPREGTRPDPMEVCRVPSYLRGHFHGAKPVWPTTEDIARAFLRHQGNTAPDRAAKGIVKVKACCRSADGGQILMLADDTFYHCNLKTQTLSTWAAPTALAKANVDLHEVCDH